MKRTILILLFCVVASQAADQQYLLDYRLARNEESSETTVVPPPKKCERPGLMCATCKLAIMCVDLGGKLQDIKTQECKTGFTCLQGQCTNQTNYPCMDINTGPILCNSIGMFPDPYDCTAFHVCPKIGQNSAMHYCASQHTYDPISTYCKPTTAGCPLTPPVPYCQSAGQTGAIINKSIFYICLEDNGKWVPRLYICASGKSYLNNKCS